MTDKIERAQEAIDEAKRYTDEGLPESSVSKSDPDTRDDDESGPAEAVSNVADEFQNNDRDE
ncbi:hypothetical protein HQ346_04545 [Rhodococcus sp. BP-252]|uniref:Uncharacterized protein n=1 Tax=Rhodococcoides kyotonense TaxID=398843 RepID=A0A177YJI4_9NOCA|nr:MULTISPECIES: hypothetical protein [Rhodococcus]MBY6410692.1 hypothetical protein [Rhodococcus sp. BP-320]MBY6415483.1 hypothetical protein [Rhodococcus sp. BP-321]MBY6420098.1 hypothetical protein [Rhodococcus sp. BP-324]MBY6425248.1 hypothetical protein [Rhodococcus sp. BP-323]MBY6430689.1 hypothetical protein [Rhodococcus sp. BP-322]